MRGCSGFIWEVSDGEEFWGLSIGDQSGMTPIFASVERYSQLSGDETLETGEAISRRLYG